MADFVLHNEGSIVLLEPETDEAKAWAEEHIDQDNSYQPLWPTVLLEPRYVQDILEGIKEIGLTVEL